MERLNFETFDMNDFIELIDSHCVKLDELLNTGTYEIPRSLQETFAELVAQTCIAHGGLVCPAPPVDDIVDVLHQASPKRYEPLNFTREQIDLMYESFGFAVYGYNCGSCEKTHTALILNADQNHDLTTAVVVVSSMMNAYREPLIEQFGEQIMLKVCKDTIMDAFSGTFSPNATAEFFGLDIDVQQFNINLN